jgi:hypothetical protein
LLPEVVAAARHACLPSPPHLLLPLPVLLEVALLWRILEAVAQLWCQLSHSLPLEADGRLLCWQGLHLLLLWTKKPRLALDVA